MSKTKLTLLLISGLTIMAASIVAPSLADIANEFAEVPHASLLAKLVLSIPAIFIAISAPIAGTLIDRIGRIRLLLFGLILYAVSGTSAIYLDSIYAILVGRVFLGMSIGICSTVAVTLIGDYFQGPERKKFIGIQAAYIGIIGVVFLSLGGYLAEPGWRYPFYIYALTLLILPLAASFLPEPPRHEQERVPFKSTPVLNILFASAMIWMVLFYVIPTQLPFLLADYGFSANKVVGNILALNALGMMVASLSYQRIGRRLSHSLVYGLGFVLMGAGFCAAGFSGNLAVVTSGMFSVGLGIGLVWPNTNFWVLELASEQTRGRATGILTMCLFTGQFLSPLLVQPILGSTGQPALFVIVGCAFVVLALAYALFGRRLHG